MTLEEAIQHLEETLANENHRWSCEKCKREHEDLLSFLRELETYRKNGKVGDSEKLFNVIINEPKSKMKNFRLKFYGIYYQQLADMANQAYIETMEEEDSNGSRS